MKRSKRMTALLLALALALSLGVCAAAADEAAADADAAFLPSLFYDEWYRLVYVDESGHPYYVDADGYPTYLGTPVDDHYDDYGSDYTLPFYEVNGVWYRRELLHFQRTRSYTPGMFRDVPEGAWYTASVASVYELGLMGGDGDGSFNPDGSVTMAEALAMAARISAIYRTGSADFTQGSPWYQVYWDYVDENSYVFFWDAHSFRPSAPVTREEFAILLAASIPVRHSSTQHPQAIYDKNDWKTINEILYSDIRDIDDGMYMHADLILRLYTAGVLTGSDAAGSFRPNTQITRKEAAAIIERIAFPELRKRFTPTTHTPIGRIECYDGTCLPTVECVLGRGRTEEYDRPLEDGGTLRVFRYAGASQADYESYRLWLYDYADGVSSEGGMMSSDFCSVHFGPIGNISQYSVEYSDQMLTVSYRCA